jgi:hypothetical protein
MRAIVIGIRTVVEEPIGSPKKQGILRMKTIRRGASEDFGGTKTITRIEVRIGKKMAMLCLPTTVGFAAAFRRHSIKHRGVQLKVDGGIPIKIELYHASKFGNGAKVAEELRRVMEAKGQQMNVQHIDDAEAKELPLADLYIFGSPTRFGGPIGSMRKFIKKASLPPGTKYALFATHADAVPNKRTGKLPPEEELDRERKTIPELDEIAKEKGWVKVADKIFHVSADAMKGPLKDGWQAHVQEFATAILGSS